MRLRRRAEGLARREVDDGVHRQMIRRVEHHAEVARVVGFAPLHRARELRPTLTGVNDQLVINREHAVARGKTCGRGNHADGRVARQHRTCGCRLQGLGGERIDRSVQAGRTVDCARIVTHGASSRSA